MPHETLTSLLLPTVIDLKCLAASHPRLLRSVVGKMAGFFDAIKVIIVMILIGLIGSRYPLNSRIERQNEDDTNQGNKEDTRTVTKVTSKEEEQIGRTNEIPSDEATNGNDPRDHMKVVLVEGGDVTTTCRQCGKGKSLCVNCKKDPNALGTYNGTLPIDEDNNQVYSSNSTNDQVKTIAVQPNTQQEIIQSENANLKPTCSGENVTRMRCVCAIHKLHKNDASTSKRTDSHHLAFQQSSTPTTSCSSSYLTRSENSEHGVSDSMNAPGKRVTISAILLSKQDTYISDKYEDTDSKMERTMSSILRSQRNDSTNMDELRGSEKTSYPKISLHSESELQLDEGHNSEDTWTAWNEEDNTSGKTK